MKQLFYFYHSYWGYTFFSFDIIITTIKYLKSIPKSTFKILLGLFDVLLSVGLAKICREFDKAKTRLFFRIA